MSTRTRFIMVAAVAALSSSFTFAAQDGWRGPNNEGGPVFSGVPASGLTREQVKQELDQARRDGSLRAAQRSRNYVEPGSPERAGFVSTPTQRARAAATTAPVQSGGWQYIGGEAGWIYED